MLFINYFLFEDVGVLKRTGLFSMTVMMYLFGNWNKVGAGLQKLWCFVSVNWVTVHKYCFKCKCVDNTTINVKEILIL